MSISIYNEILPLANTIASFANGKIVAVGIEDDGKITVFQNIDDKTFKGF